MKKLLFICVAFLIGLTGDHVLGYTTDDCVKCHGEGSKESALYISMETFEASVHGREKMACRDCHKGVIDNSHKKVKGSGGVDCNACHDQENRHGSKSKDEDWPQCHSCHSRHGILEKDNPSSSVHPARLKETCKRCHPLECGEVGYLSWFPSLKMRTHGKQDFSQTYKRSNCVGCHQAMASHGDDIRLNEQNCFKCHLPNSKHPGLWGYIHPKADSKKQPGIFAAGVIYQIMLVLLLCGGVAFWIKKFFR